MCGVYVWYHRKIIPPFANVHTWSRIESELGKRNSRTQHPIALLRFRDNSWPNTCAIVQQKALQTWKAKHAKQRWSEQEVRVVKRGESHSLSKNWLYCSVVKAPVDVLKDTRSVVLMACICSWIFYLRFDIPAHVLFAYIIALRDGQGSLVERRPWNCHAEILAQCLKTRCIRLFIWFASLLVFHLDSPPFFHCSRSHIRAESPVNLR